MDGMFNLYIFGTVAPTAHRHFYVATFCNLFKHPSIYRSGMIASGVLIFNTCWDA